MKLPTEYIKETTRICYLLRIAIACTFIGHGMNALAIKPNWLHLLTVYGFSVEQAITLMPVIGILDLIVALFMLFRPFKIIIAWAIFWTFATAITRFIAGEPIWEFIERTSNWSAPLALLLLNRIRVYEASKEWPMLIRKSALRRLKTTTQYQ